MIIAQTAIFCKKTITAILYWGIIDAMASVCYNVRE